MIARWTLIGPVNRQTDRQKDNVALAHPYNKGKSRSKFDSIPLSCLGGDSVTDRWADAGLMDGQTDGKLMFLPYTFTMKGSHVTNLVKLRPVV